MPARKNIDWNAVQTDRDAGMPVSGICKKYGVSNPTVYTRTKALSTNGRKHAGGAIRPKSQSRGGRFNGADPLDTASILAALRKLRDAVTSAIEAIEQFE